jgi:hypothetical protein
MSLRVGAWGNRDVRDRPAVPGDRDVAYHFHWPLGELLDLEHADRRRYVSEIDSINMRHSRGR